MEITVIVHVLNAELVEIVFFCLGCFGRDFFWCFAPVFSPLAPCSCR